MSKPPNDTPPPLNKIQFLIQRISSSDLKLTQLTKAQGQDLCLIFVSILVSTHFPLQDKT